MEKKTAKLSETVIERHAIEWLNLQPGVKAIKYNNKGFFNKNLGAVMKMPYGCHRGTPDILVLLRGGGVFWIEMKTDTGTQSPEQIEFEKTMKELDIGYYLCRNISQVRAALAAERCTNDQ